MMFPVLASKCVVCCMAFAVCCSQIPVECPLGVTVCCMLILVCCSLFVDACLLYVAWRVFLVCKWLIAALLVVVCCSLRFVVRCLPFVAFCLVLCAVWCVLFLFVWRCASCAMRCVLFDACCWLSAPCVLFDVFVWSLLSIARPLQSVVCCRLFCNVWCVGFAMYCLLNVGCCLFLVCWLSFDVCRLLSVVRYDVCYVVCCCMFRFVVRRALLFDGCGCVLAAA